MLGPDQERHLTGMMTVVIAVILSTVATIAAAGLGLYAHGLRRQIRDICAQSEFIEKHGSNKLVSVDIRDKAVLELVSCMNGLLEEKRRVAIQAKNGACQLHEWTAGGKTARCDSGEEQ